MRIGGISSVTTGTEAVQAARIQEESAKFSDVVESLKEKNVGAGKNITSAQILGDGRLNGDYRSSFAGTFSSPADRTALPTGAAADSASASESGKTIDRTSRLYEKSLEMESYFVKMLVSSMRKTVTRADGESDFARNMYEDMLYDEYTTTMTKNAHFGLADQIYLQLA